MKNFLAIFLTILTFVTLPACGKKEEAVAPAAPAPSQYMADIEKERQRADSAQRAREEEQLKREAAEDRADSLKTLVLVVVICGVIFTLIGVAIGSAARRKASKGRENE